MSTRSTDHAPGESGTTDADDLDVLEQPDRTIDPDGETGDAAGDGTEDTASGGAPQPPR